jgi:TRAP-type C4-dicarboxylate transport system permease small subunit
VAFLIFAGLLFLYTWQYFWETVQFGSTTRTIWDPPLAPWQAPIPIGLLVIIMLLIVNLYHQIKVARGREKAIEEEAVKDIM